MFVHYSAYLNFKHVGMTNILCSYENILG